MYSSRSSWRGRNINMRTLRRPAGKVARRSSRPNAGNEPGLQPPHPRRQAFGVVAETIAGMGQQIQSEFQAAQFERDDFAGERRKARERSAIELQITVERAFETGQCQGGQHHLNSLPISGSGARAGSSSITTVLAILS